MWGAIERIEVDAPPERVWAIVSDIEGHAALAGSGEVLAIRMLGPLAEGVWFEGDIRTGEVGSFVSRNRVDVLDPPRALCWRSYPPLDPGETEDHQIEVTWWFRLAPSATGTAVEHEVSVAPPKAGAEGFAAFLERTGRVATVRAGMARTLANLKARAEGA